MTALDDLDRGLLHALHLDARAPFTEIADVLGTSTQTVTRRYQRLVRDAGLRVTGLPDAAGTRQQQWIVRLTATPGPAHDIAHALARRADTAWVRLTSGGTEIVAIVRSEPGAGNSLLLRDVPRTSSVTSVSAHYMLHTYLGGPTAWRGHVDALSLAQQQELARPTGSGEPVDLGDADRALLAALAQDGRVGYAALAAVTGWSASTVARRIEHLRTRGALFFDVEVDDSRLGVTASALLWMSVPPAQLDVVAAELAGHAELAVVAATTGRTNLLANALCADTEALHRYLTTRLALPAITHLETTPILRTLKAVAPAGAASVRAGRGRPAR
ncbi:DNA-binding Lrp family transcriptional regulator [Amycolatopsis endophytica]|uniref:DNA-binding Lrp family transcriptional regulator n=1 Tax=Amycolatopsis endophytica TaxID=860233 RepID=A0A853B4M9_9PSEU|nr:Lrp/AsnC family transcriptional regulator [Amycolatopsis endophytica]NYI90163.1 DNA-binding Lrp family transcriptional regulator [Amycolatopsis endophytica]